MGYEKTLGDANLRPGQSYTVSLIHCFDHSLSEYPEAVIELSHFLAFLSEDFFAELDDIKHGLTVKESRTLVNYAAISRDC